MFGSTSKKEHPVLISDVMIMQLPLADTLQHPLDVGQAVVNILAVDGHIAKSDEERPTILTSPSFIITFYSPP